MAEYCVTCSTLKIENPNPVIRTVGVIYVRKQVNGKCGSYPQCMSCWNTENPDIVPFQALVTDEVRLNDI